MALQNANTREAYRILYPERERPHLRIVIMTVPEHGRLYGASRPIEAPGAAEVLECSESGLRFRPPPAWPFFAVGTVVRGRVQFRLTPHACDTRIGAPGLGVSVQGHVVRMDGRVVVLQLCLPGVPFAVIMGEQSALLARYPYWGIPIGPSPADMYMEVADGSRTSTDRSRSPPDSV